MRRYRHLLVDKSRLGKCPGSNLIPRGRDQAIFL
jgi:hypothetical protein